MSDKKSDIMWDVYKLKGNQIAKSKYQITRNENFYSEEELIYLVTDLWISSTFGWKSWSFSQSKQKLFKEMISKKIILKSL